MLLVGGLAVLALIVGLLFGSPGLLVALVGVVVSLVLLRKTPALAALGAGLNLLALLILYVVGILFGN